MQRGKIGLHQWDVSVVDAISRHLLIVSLEQLLSYYKQLLKQLVAQPAYLATILTPPAMLFTKVTFFIMYLDIFRPMRWLRIGAIIGGLVTAIFYAIITICALIFTTPGRHESWLEHVIYSHGYHVDVNFGVPQSSVGLTIDLYILILPILGVSKLQMPTRRKVAVMLIFMSAIVYEPSWPCT